MWQSSVARVYHIVSTQNSSSTKSVRRLTGHHGASEIVLHSYGLANEPYPHWEYPQWPVSKFKCLCRFNNSFLFLLQRLASLLGYFLKLQSVWETEFFLNSKNLPTYVSCLIICPKYEGIIFWMRTISDYRILVSTCKGIQECKGVQLWVKHSLVCRNELNKQWISPCLT